MTIRHRYHITVSTECQKNSRPSGTVLHSSFCILHLRKLRDCFCQFSGRNFRLFQCIPRRADLDEQGVGPQVLVVAVFRQGQAAADPGDLLFQQDH